MVHVIKCSVCGTQESKRWYASLIADWCERCVPPKVKAMFCAHCSEKPVTHLDGEELCQTHANEWVRGEGMAAQERERDGRSD